MKYAILCAPKKSRREIFGIQTSNLGDSEALGSLYESRESCFYLDQNQTKTNFEFAMNIHTYIYIICIIWIYIILPDEHKTDCAAPARDYWIRRMKMYRLPWFEWRVTSANTFQPYLDIALIWEACRYQMMYNMIYRIMYRMNLWICHMSIDSYLMDAWIGDRLTMSAWHKILGG